MSSGRVQYDDGRSEGKEIQTAGKYGGGVEEFQDKNHYHQRDYGVGRGHGGGLVTFNKSDFLHHMSTVVEEDPDHHLLNETKELDELERFLRDQGIHIREGFNNPTAASSTSHAKGFFDERRAGMSSVFEQKRHYEQEIEGLKRDLELIEIEE